MGIIQKINDVMDFKEQFVDKLNVVFGDWALFVYDRPYKIIVCSLLLSLPPAIGFVPPIAKWVDGADNLYSLPVSEARNDGIIHDHYFQDVISQANFIALTSEPPGQNLLTWDMLEWVRQVDDIARGNRADPTTGQIVALPANEMYYPEWFQDPSHEGLEPDKKWLRYDDMCAPDPVTGCKIQSVFEMGIDDMKLMLDEGSAPELWMFDGLVFNSLRKGFCPNFVFGDFEKKNCTRQVPTTLISQIFSPDRYTELADKPGYAESNIECIYSVKAMRFTYEIWDKPEFTARELAWEWNLYNVFQQNEYYGPLHIGAMAFRTRDDELSKSTAESDDVIFVVYTFILLVTYAAIINFNLDQYRSKALSSLCGSLSCLLGLYAGLGVPALWGTVFTPTALVCPFIVMGVGADDIFVVIGSYALAYGEDTPRDRCAVTLRGCGVSVVMTTVTNVIAFAIGTQTQYLSIKTFCIFTLFGLLFSLIYELTLFFAVVCIEAQKEEAQMACICGGGLSSDQDALDRKKRYNIFDSISTYQVVSVLVEEGVKDDSEFLMELKDPIVITEHRFQWMNKVHKWWIDFSKRGNYWHAPDVKKDDQLFSSANEALTDALPASGVALRGNARMIDREESYIKFMPRPLILDRFDLHPKLKADVYRMEPPHNVGKTWRTFFMKHYCHYLLKPWVKLLVLILFAGNLGVSFYGLTQLQQGLEMEDLSPDNSYLKQFDHMVNEYLSEVDLPVEMFYVGDDIPWHESRVIETLRRFVNVVNDDPGNFLLNDPLTRMADDAALKPSLMSNNKTEFNRALQRAISDPDSAYKQFELDFVWKGETMMTFRQQLLPMGTTGSQERAGWMLQLRAYEEEFRQLPITNTTYPLDPHFYNYLLVFYESDITIQKSVISSLTTASMALLVVTLMLIPDLSSGLVVIIIMFLIDVAVIGYMSFWDVPLNMISMVILVISIGFAVDYSAHLCYAFVNAVGPSRDVRVAEAMVLVGTPLFHGAMSNFLGIVMLGFSTSYILRIFFKMMTLVVLLGISHGLILLPVVLGTWGAMAQAVPVSSNTLHAVNDEPVIKVRRKIDPESLEVRETALNDEIQIEHRIEPIDLSPKDNTPIPLRR
ncbi:patched family protein [Gregarina niphandrodes]|uniref:Patched family protein n=1 Tax=Gregarina niphandrodes TaxID=110365 RepID=A0A023BC11_GRENI|nr:patched family protein [Gregarina niphandrodes]EZG81693.1 patched family protein [Gregarina niphandrodes]|eukprot:XP_011134199.1 patched family protein [Gregarina niphandrodes]